MLEPEAMQKDSFPSQRIGRLRSRASSGCSTHGEEEEAKYADGLYKCLCSAAVEYEHANGRPTDLAKKWILESLRYDAHVPYAFPDIDEQTRLYVIPYAVSIATASGKYQGSKRRMKNHDVLVELASLARSFDYE
jgi:hypothetical protein